MKSTNDPKFQIEKSKLETHLAGLIRQPLDDFIQKNDIKDIIILVGIDHIDVSTKDGIEESIIKNSVKVKIVL